jgi:hypothetical protein
VHREVLDHSVDGPHDGHVVALDAAGLEKRCGIDTRQDATGVVDC